jgi:hypothetical protein
VNEAGSLMRAFGTNGVGHVKYFVHPCEQVSDRRFLSLHRRGCHASDYTAKIGSMLVSLPRWPYALGSRARANPFGMEELSQAEHGS